MDRISLSNDDLAANKQGTLSVAQRETLRSRRWVWIVGTIGILGILGSLTTVLTLKLFNPAFADRGQLFILIPVAFFWLWILRGNPRKWLQANRDLRQGKVSSVTGTAVENLSMGIGLYRMLQYNIQIEGCRFRVSQEIFSQFRNGESYRVYHSPHAKVFLGALAVVQGISGIDGGESAVSQVLLEPLTEREKEVLDLIAAGLTNKEIANQLSLSTNTIKMYASQLYQKLDVSRRTEAVARAREIGLLEE